MSGPAAVRIARTLLQRAPAIRYVAIMTGGSLVTTAAPGRSDASGGESDRYEELLVNPTMLDLAKRRGREGCGGFDFLIVRYGAFFQVLVPAADGHVSVCVEPDGDPTGLVPVIRDVTRELGTAPSFETAPIAEAPLAAEPFVLGDLDPPGLLGLRALYAASDGVRYVAFNVRGRVLLSSRVEDPETAADRSDRYEELIVNPTLLAIATARGEIDCGGLRFLVVAYPTFFALVLPLLYGHATISLPRDSDPIALVPELLARIGPELCG